MRSIMALALGAVVGYAGVCALAYWIGSGR